MRQIAGQGGTDRALLAGALLLPIVYYGIQLALAPLTPGYSLLRDAASLLGRADAPYAAWFNGAAMLSGLCAAAGAIGLFRALTGSAPSWLRWLFLIAILALGLGNIWAGIFPLPDQRHRDNPFAPAFFVMPVLLAASAWRAPGLRGLRPYLTVNLLCFGLFAVVMAGLTGIDRGAWGGLLQRFGAFTIFGAIGVVGWSLLSRRAAPAPARTPPRT